MLTRLQRLEIENQVLRESIELVRKAHDRVDQAPLRKRYDGSMVPQLLGSIDCAVDYEDFLKRKLEMAEYLQKEKPRQDP